jgi:Flp pilus assembly protein TadD
LFRAGTVAVLFFALGMPSLWAEDLEKRAVSLLEQGKVAEAEGAFRSLLVSYPDRADLHHVMGVILSQLGRPSEATVHFSRAAGLSPDRLKYRYSLALNYAALKRVADARRELHAASTLRDRDVRLMGTLALNLAQFGMYADAERVYLQLPQDDVNVRHDLALVYHRWGQHDRAFALEPQNVEIAYAHGLALLADNKTAEASAVFRRFRNVAKMRLGLAIAAFGEGRNEESTALVSEAIAMEPASAPLHVSLADLYAAAGRREDASRAYAEAIRLDPTDLSHRVKAGVNLLALGRSAEARKLFESAAANTEARYELGKMDLSDGRVDSAIAHLEAADPSSSRVQYQLALAYRRAGKTRESEEAMRRFRELKDQ